MRASFISTILLIPAMLTAPITAQEAKPNTLTPKEIADGWILLFDGETPFGWRIDGEVSVKDGVLIFGGKKETSAWITTAFGTFEMHYDFKVDGKVGGIKDHPNTRNWVQLWTSARVGTKVQIDGFAPFGGGELRSGGWFRGVEKVEFSLKDNSRAHTSERYTPLLSASSSPGELNQNKIQLLIAEGATVSLRNVKLKPLSQTLIFNGRDLSGWKDIPGKKSRYSVNDKGELNIKDGPNDLQTTGEWDDFVLQLDVFSNGKHLNSGVFFRCQPGQFWSGYEAQIRNQWLGDRTFPIDYGTGGIYNHQSARKVVSSDKEWFTMTVVAHGSHLATWVNGYQVTDFTDKRKPDASARKGLKVDKGPISLQGHDPTTDLSFRNIRVEAMPKGVETKK